MDYLPTNDYKSLGFNSQWGNKKGSPSSKVEFQFTGAGGAPVKAECTIRSARNEGISVTGSVPAELGSTLRKSGKFFSAYIPGISGIPNKESKLSQRSILKACSYGDSNVVLRNVLLQIQSKGTEGIKFIEDSITRLVEPIKLHVSHNEEKDLYIKCNVEIGGVIKPIELLGTGLLQLIQMFCYIQLFKPGVLLIDEPDIHLHPSVQEKLIAYLADVARNEAMKIIVSTHSPFIVRGAPSYTKVYWLNGGRVESQNRSTIEQALGWGAFGKKILLFSEDNKPDLLKHIIKQWPEIERSVSVVRGNGFKDLYDPDEAKDLVDLFGGLYKVVIHRDRDSMTESEVYALKEKYAEKGVNLWVTNFSDVEAYYCDNQIIADICGIEHTSADELLSRAIAAIEGPCRDIFSSRRKSHNEELYSVGGSPSNDTVEAELRQIPLRYYKGKSVFKSIKQKSERKSFNEEQILSKDIAVEIAPDLNVLLSELMRTT